MPVSDPLQLPGRFDRDRSLREWVEKEVFVVCDIVDTEREFEVLVNAEQGAGIYDEVPVKALIGIADTIAVIERRVVAAGVARCGGQRERVVWTPRDDCAGFPVWDAGQQLADRGRKARILHRPGIGICDAARQVNSRHDVAAVDCQFDAARAGAIDVLDVAERTSDWRQRATLGDQGISTTALNSDRRSVPRASRCSSASSADRARSGLRPGFGTLSTVPVVTA